MAIYRCEFKVYSRGKAHSAVAASAYVTGTRQTGRGANGGAAKRVSAVEAAAYRSGSALAERGAGEEFDYSHKRDIVWSGIIAPDDAPAWATNRSRLWNEVERKEDGSTRPQTAQLFRECLLTIPRELTPAQQVALVRTFVRDQFVKEGMVADIGIHAPKASDGQGQPHAHVMLTMRRIGPDGFGKKERDWNGVQWKDLNVKDGRGKHSKVLNVAGQQGFLRQQRASWEDYCNAALADAGSSARVDHRSLKARGVDRQPAPKLGKAHHAKPAGWVENVHDNHVGAHFGNRARAAVGAVVRDAHHAGPPVRTSSPPILGTDPHDERTTRMRRAVHEAVRLNGARLARDGAAWAAMLAAELRGRPVEPPAPSPEVGHDR